MDKRQSTSASCDVSLHVSHVVHLESRKHNGSDNSKPDASLPIELVLPIPCGYNGSSRAVTDEAAGIDEISDYVILIGSSKVIVHPRSRLHSH